MLSVQPGTSPDERAETLLERAETSIERAETPDKLAVSGAPPPPPPLSRLRPVHALDMTPGLYFLGDPCYAFSSAAWDALCDKMEAARWPRTAAYSADGECLVVMTTLHGDGTYLDEDGNEYSVDSGLLGAVKLLAPVPRATARMLRACGRVVRFDEPFSCSSRSGLLDFGGHVIDTN